MKAREGYLDWRKEGVPGLRPLMIDFFNKVQDMAEYRLVVQEIELPLGTRSAFDESISVEKNDRWTLMWDGQNIVHKILHM